MRLRAGADMSTPSPRLPAWYPDAAHAYLATRCHRHRSPYPDGGVRCTPGLYQVEIGLYTPTDLRRLPLREAPGAEGADRLLFRHVRVVPVGTTP